MDIVPIQLLDTTLRDGQQCPGAGMSLAKNIEYAHLIAKIGIDVLEAGFPSASDLDYTIVNTIAEEVGTTSTGPIISALCQLRENQIDITMNALRPALATSKARVHTYLPVDPQLMAASLGDLAQQPEKLIQDVHRLCKHAADEGFEVEFSPEGYSRMGNNFSFATDVIAAAISGGATIINCPDTIGGACMRQGAYYFVHHMRQHAELMAKQFPNQKIIWSTHCHNDFGLALENSLNAVFDGPATQIEGCFNGIGERAGNVALEQCIMVLKHFGALSEHRHLITHARAEYIQQVSDFIATNMLLRQPHWPITGDNAARHTSGGHTNAILHNPLAYQPFDPKEVGKTISFTFGPMSGSNHAQEIIHQHGYRCDEHEKTKIAQYIKNVFAERRKGITDAELMDAYFDYRQPIKIKEFSYHKTQGHNTLTLSGRFFDQADPYEIKFESHDSVLAALHHDILRFFPGLTIEHYESQATGKGIDARSRTTINLKTDDNRLFTGIGDDRDIEISALTALIAAVNQAYIETHFRSEGG
jgi:2-isopropylmalate synthase